jgi:hypothetical protein
METLGDKIMPELCPRFCCLICDYRTSKKSSYTNHINSKKHKMVTNDYEMGQNYAQIMPTDLNAFICSCGKKYSHRQGLWRHSKQCISSCSNSTYNEQIKANGMDKDELIMMLLKQNADLIRGQQEMMKGQQEVTMELVKNGTNNAINNNNTTTHTNSHNKAFNLQFFLNETCKNAMNITDFVDSIKLQLSDFMNVGEVGFIEGISNIIVKNLNSLDETVRPIHCTDQKRETFYVKDENIWEKEDENKKRLKQMVKSVVYKNEKLMKTYKETYPDYNDPDSHRSDVYSKTVIEAMDCKEESREKIIKNISKVTTISKSS